MLNPYEYRTVYRLWSEDQIILLSDSKEDMINKAKKLNLRGWMEETEMPRYAIYLLKKDIARRRNNIN